MSKQARARDLKDNEAQAIARAIRISPRKLNLVAGLIRGKDATPYLLGRIVEITDGASLTANIALVEHNARLGAAIAREHAAR